MTARTPEEREALKAAKRAKFLSLKETLGEGRIIPRGRKGFSKAQRLAVYERAKGYCELCGEHVPAERFEIDHIVSVFLDGEHAMSNWRLAHVACHAERTKVQAGEHAHIRRLEDIEVNGRPPGTIRGRGFEAPREGWRWPKKSFGQARGWR